MSRIPPNLPKPKEPIKPPSDQESKDKKATQKPSGGGILFYAVQGFLHFIWKITGGVLTETASFGEWQQKKELVSRIMLIVQNKIELNDEQTQSLKKVLMSFTYFSLNSLYSKLEEDPNLVTKLNFNNLNALKEGVLNLTKTMDHEALSAQIIDIFKAKNKLDDTQLNSLQEILKSFSYSYLESLYNNLSKNLDLATKLNFNSPIEIKERLISLAGIIDKGALIEKIIKRIPKEIQQKEDQIQPLKTYLNSLTHFELVSLDNKITKEPDLLAKENFTDSKQIIEEIVWLIHE